MYICQKGEIFRVRRKRYFVLLETDVICTPLISISIRRVYDDSDETISLKVHTLKVKARKTNQMKKIIIQSICNLFHLFSYCDDKCRFSRTLLSNEFY